MGRGARRAERRRDRAGAFRGAGPDHRAAAEVGMAASRRAQQRGHLCSARPARGRQLVRLPHRRAVPSPGRCAPARHLFRAPIANCLAPHRSVSQKCLTLIGDLVAEPDADIDGLVRSQLLQSLVTKMADSKMIVRKAASQVHIGCPTASGSHRLTPPSQRPPPKKSLALARGERCTHPRRRTPCHLARASNGGGHYPHAAERVRITRRPRATTA